MPAQASLIPAMSIPPHLVFFSDENPGFTRKKWGRGFRYFDAGKKPLKKSAHLERIKSLVIPPAWQKVWISPKDNGHLQCTGTDQKNRKQYIYHADWMAYRQEEKFNKLKQFGSCLAHIREEYNRELRRRKWTKQKVLALILYLLDNHYFRIGNKQYASNGTYGLTTLRRKHVQEKGKHLSLQYTAKSGKARNVMIDDKKIARLIREISELPGYEVFRYLNEDNNWEAVDSSDVNDYLYELAGERFTAKNFRTWGASRLAVEKYAEAVEMVLEHPNRKFDTTLVRIVANELGNTLSVCREYYIHPEVLAFLTDLHPKSPGDQFTLKKKSDGFLSDAEQHLLQILKIK